MSKNEIETKGSIQELSAEDAKKIANDIAALETALEASEKEKEQLQEELEQAESVIEDLKAKLEDALKNASEGSKSLHPTVKVGKKTYNIVIRKFNWEGEEKTAEDVQNDDKLAAKLVELGSGVLQLLDN